MTQKIRNIILIFIDLILLNLSIALSYLLRFDIDSSVPEKLIDSLPMVFFGGSVIKISMFLIFRLYKNLWKYAGIREVISIFGAAFVGNVLLVNFVLINRIMVPRSIYIIMFMMDIFLIGMSRFSYRIIRKFINWHYRLKTNSKRVMIVGGGDLGAMVINDLKLHPELNYKPVVIIDDDEAKHGKKINSVPIAGSINELQIITKKYDVHEVIIAIALLSNLKLNNIYNLCHEINCKIKVIPAISQILGESFSIHKIRDVNIEDLLGREPVKLDNKYIIKFIKDETVLVTGGGGSIGSELCRQIAKYSPRKLIILDNYENNAFEIQNEIKRIYPGLSLQVVIANIRERERMEYIFKRYRPDIVFHTAAHKHVFLMEINPTEAINNNVFGTLNVAKCADMTGVKKFVLISTDKAVNPTNIMGATKRTAEMIIQGINKKSKTEYVAVRFGNVLGSNGSVIPILKKQIEDGGPVTVTHPEVTRYFMTIPEASQLVLQAGSMASGGEIFVLDMGKSIKIYDLAEKLIKLSGFEPGKDIKIEICGLRPGEKLYEELLLAEEGLKKTQNNKIFVAKPVDINFEELIEKLEILKKLIKNKPENVFDFMVSLVPTYIPDSKIKKLDIEGKAVLKPSFAG